MYKVIYMNLNTKIDNCPIHGQTIFKLYPHKNNPNNYNDVFIPTIETSTKYYGKDVSITVVPESEFYEK